MFKKAYKNVRNGKKENETSLIYPIHTFLRAILGDKCEKIVRKGGEWKEKKKVHVNTEKS